MPKKGSWQIGRARTDPQGRKWVTRSIEVNMVQAADLDAFFDEDGRSVNEVVFDLFRFGMRHMHQLRTLKTRRAEKGQTKTEGSTDGADKDG